MPITPIEKGGPAHRYDAREGNAAPDAPSPRASNRDDPLDRSVASWTEADLRTVLNSPVYLQPQHPQRAEAERKVRAWFERPFSRGPVPMDATGRAIRDRGHTAGTASACPVAVRAHSRNGGKVEVGAHCRSMPTA